MEQQNNNNGETCENGEVEKSKNDNNRRWTELHEQARNSDIIKLPVNFLP